MGTQCVPYLAPERSTVIPFLIVTAILNIALGYALAVYLADRRTRRRLAISQHVTRRSGDEFRRTQFAMLRMIGRRRSTTVRIPRSPHGKPPGQPADVDGTLDDYMAHQVDDEPFAHAEVMEQELLAGIEEFRNQLSQLKGQGAEPASDRGPHAAGG